MIHIVLDRESSHVEIGLKCLEAVDLLFQSPLFRILPFLCTAMIQIRKINNRERRQIISARSDILVHLRRMYR